MNSISPFQNFNNYIPIRKVSFGSQIQPTEEEFSAAVRKIGDFAHQQTTDVEIQDDDETGLRGLLLKPNYSDRARIDVTDPGRLDNIEVGRYGIDLSAISMIFTPSEQSFQRMYNPSPSNDEKQL